MNHSIHCIQTRRMFFLWGNLNIIAIRKLSSPGKREIELVNIRFIVRKSTVYQNKSIEICTFNQNVAISVFAHNNEKQFKMIVYQPVAIERDFVLLVFFFLTEVVYYHIYENPFESHSNQLKSNNSLQQLKSNFQRNLIDFIYLSHNIYHNHFIV